MRIVCFLFSTIFFLFIFAKPASSYYNARYYNPPFPRDLLEAYRKRDCGPGAPSPCPPCGGSWNGYCLANVIRGGDRKHMCWEGCLDYSKEGCPGCAATGECSIASKDHCFLSTPLPTSYPTPTSSPGIPTPTPVILPTPFLPLSCPESFFAPTIKLSCFDPFQSLRLQQEAKNVFTQKEAVSKPANFLSKIFGLFFFK